MWFLTFLSDCISFPVMGIETVLVHIRRIPPNQRNVISVNCMFYLVPIVHCGSNRRSRATPLRFSNQLYRHRATWMGWLQSHLAGSELWLRKMRMQNWVDNMLHTSVSFTLNAACSVRSSSSLFLLMRAAVRYILFENGHLRRKSKQTTNKIRTISYDSAIYLLWSINGKQNSKENECQQQ